MKRPHYITGDTHCTVTELVVGTSTGRVTKRFRCPTTIRSLAEAIKTVPRPRFLAFEEGPMADWLYRSRDCFTATVWNRFSIGAGTGWR